MLDEPIQFTDIEPGAAVETYGRELLLGNEAINGILARAEILHCLVHIQDPASRFLAVLEAIGNGISDRSEEQIDGLA
jgi:hypothetical protein